MARYITRIWRKRDIDINDVTPNTSTFIGKYDLEICSLGQPIESQDQILIPNAIFEEYDDKPMDIIIRKDGIFMVMFDPPLNPIQE